MIETQIQETRNSSSRLEWICICSTDGCNDNMLQPGSELYPATNQTYPSTTKMDLAESTTYATSKTSQLQSTTHQMVNPATNQTSHRTTNMDLVDSTTYATSKISQPQPTTHQPGKETRKDERVASEGACIHLNLLQMAFVCFIFISMI